MGVTLRYILGSQAPHAPSLENDKQSIQQSTSTHTKHFYNNQQQNNNHTHTYCELFGTQHCATHKANWFINRATHTIQGYSMTITTTQVQDAIQQSKNTNLQGTDELNIRHLKHRGPLGIAILTILLKTTLNTNIIPHIWKLANIVRIPKPNKDIDRTPHTDPYPLSQ